MLSVGRSGASGLKERDTSGFPNPFNTLARAALRTDLPDGKRVAVQKVPSKIRIAGKFPNERPGLLRLAIPASRLHFPSIVFPFKNSALPL